MKLRAFGGLSDFDSRPRSGTLRQLLREYDEAPAQGTWTSVTITTPIAEPDPPPPPRTPTEMTHEEVQAAFEEHERRMLEMAQEIDRRGKTSCTATAPARARR